MAMHEKQLSLFGNEFKWRWPKWFNEENRLGTQLYDRKLLLAILSLIAIGFVMVMSASMPEAEKLKGDPFYFVNRHVGYIVGCVIIAFVVLKLEVRWWQRLSPLMLIGVFLGLIAVLLVGHSVNGATRWLMFGPIRIQVAEVAKFTFCVYLAGYLVRRHQEVREKMFGFLKPILVLIGYAGLILMQPDLGSVVVLFVITIGLLWLAGARLIDFSLMLLFGTVLFVFLIVTAEYRMRRVTSFMNPWDDPFGSGYQLTQSLMAYGRGDWIGQGLGNSIQKLEYLPEAHTDFIFAVIGEELGFVGIVAILSLILFVVLRAIRLGNQCLKDNKPFDGYLSYAIGIWICFQTIVNVGASIGMLPTKGLTLPFISYGGSSLWIMMAAVMLLLRIDHERRLEQVQAVQRRGTS